MCIWAERYFAEEVSIASDFLKSKGYKIPNEKELNKEAWIILELMWIQ